MYLNLEIEILRCKINKKEIAKTKVLFEIG